LQLRPAEGDNLVAFHLLVSAQSNVVTTLLRSSCRAIAVQDAGLEMTCLLQREHRTYEDGVTCHLRNAL